MYPQTHFLFPLAVGLLLNKLGYISVKLALIASIIGLLVDIDHYIELIIHKRSFSFVEAWNNAVKYHSFNGRSFIHHKAAAVVIGFLLLLVSYFDWAIALAIALGYYSHLFLDYVHIKHLRKLSFNAFGLLVEENISEVLIDIFLLLVVLAYFVF